MNTEIKNNKVWLDTDGNRIQAHGSSIYFIDGKFYWLGENKEGVTGRAFGQCKIWHNGVNLYSSNDLYNWKNEGTILKSDDENNPFHPSMIMDRPHLIYNDVTKKYVIWAKTAGRFLSPDWGESTMAVATSDNLKGPYTVQKIIKQPDMPMGDFDLVKRPDGTAYIIYERPHTHIICQKLTPDYQDVTDQLTKHFESPYPPFTREAPCFFERKGKKYILTSGTTSYFPNATRIAEISDDFTTFTDLGKACVNDEYDNSFGYQFSCVLQHPTKDLYIAVADKWLTDLPHPKDMPNTDELHRQIFTGERPPEEIHKIFSSLTKENTSLATYAFLPIKFDKDVPYIEYIENWKCEDYD